MQQDIGHPHYRPAKISCGCGVVYDTFSTRGDFPVDICGKCHPFYTGQQRATDTAGRIERFRKRYEKVEGAPATDKPAPTK